MSYIRAASSGEYVHIPEGSQYYIYDDGDDIEGWSHPEFAALIGGVIEELPDWAFESQSKAEIRDGFAGHFGGWEDEYKGGVAPPERGEIFCQCVDRRIGDIELIPELHRAVRAWSNEFDALRECEHCGEDYRPYIHSEPYYCGDEECDIAQQANLYDLTFEESRRVEVINREIDHRTAWDFLEAHGNVEALTASDDD